MGPLRGRKSAVERNKGGKVPNRGVVVCANAELKLPGDAGRKIEKEEMGIERQNTSATDETEAGGCRRCWRRGMLAGEEVR